MRTVGLSTHTYDQQEEPNETAEAVPNDTAAEVQTGTANVPGKEAESDAEKEVRKDRASGAQTRSEQEEPDTRQPDGIARVIAVTTHGQRVCDMSRAYRPHQRHTHKQ